jgi:hypothetical protein
LNATATIETITAPEMSQSVSMSGFSFEQRLDASEDAHAHHLQTVDPMSCRRESVASEAYEAPSAIRAPLLGA